MTAQSPSYLCCQTEFLQIKKNRKGTQFLFNPSFLDARFLSFLQNKEIEEILHTKTLARDLQRFSEKRGLEENGTLKLHKFSATTTKDSIRTFTSRVHNVADKETKIFKAQKNNFFGSDSQGVTLSSIFFPAEESMTWLGVPWSEGQKIFQEFKDCPVNFEHNGVIIGFPKDISFTDKGMEGVLEIFAPVRVPEHIEEMRFIKANILSGDIKQISVSFYLGTGTNGINKCCCLEISVCYEGRLPVGDFKMLKFSKSKAKQQNY